jgi:hypothetical protein
MARLTTSTKLIPGLAACTALSPRDAVSTRPLKLLIEQPIAAGLPGNAPSLHLALGRRSPILQRGSLWLAHRVVRTILRMAASGEAHNRAKILHTRGSSAPRWMELVSRTADKANPASSVTHPSRLWPGSVGQTHSTGYAVPIAPVGTFPVSTYRQRAITSLRASAMIMMRRTRPLRSPTRL